MFPSLTAATAPYLLCLPVLGAVACTALGLLARHLQARWSLTGVEPTAPDPG